MACLSQIIAYHRNEQRQRAIAKKIADLTGEAQALLQDTQTKQYHILPAAEYHTGHTHQLITIIHTANG